jgi:D-alanyl-lipoteichoic acid acyltransferase DltB (MBOAT superfamily)
MLFNSYEFLFVFLPITVGVFLVLAALGKTKAAAGWLALASVYFYGYWEPRYVVLLALSIGFNFAAGRAILRANLERADDRSRQILWLAVVANLLVLGYFKYTNFLVQSINALGANLPVPGIVLPIGISFFTFTQIAFLVDSYQRKVHESALVPYTLFVTFYPHLIAGPVLHHAEMMPQFAKDSTYRFNLGNFVVGLGFLAIGLFKKVVLADGIQPYVAPVFDSDPAYTLTALEAWGGALAYTMQLYFDFSGYSDMAIGLAKMLNVDLPLNFNSPYKAANIADFWRRWHMTLSRFLRDYLYIPLGGNRKGPTRRHINLMTTMLLGGLWHGAGWTFVVWGGLHGLYLVVHQFWQAARRRLLRQDPDAPPSPAGRAASVLLTFLAVVVAWVFFRATSFDAALRVLQAMAGWNGLALPVEWRDASLAQAAAAGWVRFENLEAFGGTRQWTLIGLLMLAVWLLPNSQELVERARTSRLSFLAPKWAWMSLGSLGLFVFLLAAINGSHGSSEFIYFNF